MSDYNKKMAARHILSAKKEMSQQKFDDYMDAFDEAESLINEAIDILERVSENEQPDVYYEAYLIDHLRSFVEESGDKNIPAWRDAIAEKFNEESEGAED